MNFHILTLFPDMVMQGLNTSIIGKAVEKGLLSIEAVNIRDYTENKHGKVDDYPYGGGAGMLMQAQPVYDAWKAVADRAAGAENGEKKRIRTIYVTPQGPTFTQTMAKELAQEEELIFLCGHYEGIDERVLEEVVTDYVSIGDYVLTGGELPAMVMIDAISRMVPGVLNNEVSGVTESFEGDLLEYPQYSRPEEWMGKKVPQVLLSGNEKKIREWRRESAEQRTKERRPDLYEKYSELQECRRILAKKKLLHIDMTELIARGQAELVAREGESICLRDRESGIYFLSATDLEKGKCLLRHIPQGPETTAVLHQEFLRQPAMEYLQAEPSLNCYQAVYTKKEKLPITGLYSIDPKAENDLPQIRRLTTSYAQEVFEHYSMGEHLEYVRDRIEKGWMFGAFVDGKLAGFIGMHTEGSLGMLEVLPEYRGRGIGRALETYAVNISLEQGYTPFGQVVEDNLVSIKLQESLGFYFAKDKVYWVESK